MEPEKIDLAPLDPAADRERWERTIARVAERGAAAAAARAAATRRRAGPAIGTQIAAWARPALAVAAGIALAVWGGAALREGAGTGGSEGRPGGEGGAEEAAAAVARWALSGELPPAAEILTAFGEGTVGGDHDGN